MYSKQYGSGPEIVVGLHGWGGDHRTFEPLEPWRPSHSSLLAVDLPGYGRSAPPAAWSLESIAADICDHLDHSGVLRFSIVGNCSGAVVGLYVAKLVSERIERFVLIDPFAFIPWYFKIFLLGTFGRTAYRTTFATSLGRSITNGALAHRRTRSSHLTASFETIDHETVFRYLKMMEDVGDIQRFSAFTMPLTLAYGENTFAAVKESITRWKAVWPQAASFELSGAGHLPIVEAPQALAPIVFGDAVNGAR